MRTEDRVLFEHRRRLALLEERIARHGDNAPPEWLTEAEDIRITIARLRLLRALRKPLDAPQPLRRVIDWPAVYDRAAAFLVAFAVLLLFLLVFVSVVR
jgi:hypothetical protein